MKKLLLTGAIAVSSGLSFAQTTLFSEDFETGGAGFTLNTANLGGQSGLAGTNAWVVNNSYTGGSGTSSCFGLSFSIGTTPSQPGGITNGPNSYYMHILSDDGTSNGITNANYAPADGSFCFFAESNFSRMTTAVSTLGYSNVTFSFYWLGVCSTTSFGEVYYSLDGGTTWILKQGSMYNAGAWTQVNLTDAVWNNTASLMFGFRFVNNTSSTGADPSFSVDQVSITGTSGGSTSIATSAFSPTSWCYGNTISEVLDFTATGSYNAGNVFSAELSDPTGSFAAPTIIGTLTSSSSGPLSINVTIPGSVPTGGGYRIRVVSSNPITIGTDNGTNIAVNAIPNVSLSSFSNVCNTAAAFSLSGGTPVGGVYSGTGVSGGMFDPATAGVGTHIITYTYTDANTCSSSANASIVVDDCSSLDELSEDGIAVFPNPAEGHFYLSDIQGVQGVSLVDANGRLVKVYQTGDTKFSLEGVHAGTYFVRVVTEQTISMKPLVVR